MRGNWTWFAIRIPVAVKEPRSGAIEDDGLFEIGFE